MSERRSFTLKATSLSVMKPTESRIRPSLITDITLRIAGDWCLNLSESV
jgi:hypothetical protein